jgi:transcriptional regulator with XRE-family HTH domain
MARRKKGEPGLVEQLREAIRTSGRTLSELEEACGIGKDRLSRFVRGERGIGLEAAERICAALNLRLTPAPKRARRRPPAEDN